MSIGEKIYELASALGVTRQTISKWETGESSPDFDKIVPLCNFFEISTDELLKGENHLEKEIIIEKKRNKSLMISMCIIIFVVMCISAIFLEDIGASDSLMAAVSLTCLGAISIILVNFFLTRTPKKYETKGEYRKEKLLNETFNLLLFLMYLGVSFLFDIWEYSWVIIIIGLLVKRVIELLFILRGEKNDK